MAFLWRKIMSVGNDVIDHGHRHLIGIVNTIELLLQKPEDNELVLEALNQLQEASIRQFRLEERIQGKISYPKILQHRREHKNLLKQLDNEINKILQFRTAEEVKEHAPDLILFLRNWVVDHVIHEDMLLKPYLAKYPRGFS